MFKKKEIDGYLHQSLETDRFRLLICSKKLAFKISLQWKDDPEILRNMMLEVKPYNQVTWYKVFKKPDQYKRFYHAIVDKETNKAIGLHRSSVDSQGTVSLALVVHSKKWWGKDVYFETRAKIIEHFAKSERTERFYGRCLDRNFASIYNYKKLGFRLIGFDNKTYKDESEDRFHGTCMFEKLVDREHSLKEN